MNCLKCSKSEAGQMLFIEDYCWDCLLSATRETGLPVEVLVDIIKDGGRIVA